MMYWEYLKYVLRHKWFVLQECWKRGLYWRGIVHDLSKFRPDEFIPYARHFYGTSPCEARDSTGYYKPTDTGDRAFDMAWFRHQKRNDHHWQWWILPEDSGGIKVLPMIELAWVEMFCDWIGASKAQGHGPNLTLWYVENKDKMQLHEDTREYIDQMIWVQNIRCGG